MISGISRENPALDFVRYIEYVWSPYEVMGETIINTGAMTPVMKETIPMVKLLPEKRGHSWQKCSVYNRGLIETICTTKRDCLWN